MKSGLSGSGGYLGSLGDPRALHCVFCFVVVCGFVLAFDFVLVWVWFLTLMLLWFFSSFFLCVLCVVCCVFVFVFVFSVWIGISFWEMKFWCHLKVVGVKVVGVQRVRQLADGSRWV